MLEIHRQGDVISAVVSGFSGTRDRVYIRLQELAGGTEIRGECSCQEGYNCEHVAAALLHAKLSVKHLTPQKTVTPVQSPKQKSSALPHEYSSWLKELEQQTLQAKDELPDTPQHLLYVLKLNQPNLLSVDFFTCRLLKEGGFGKVTYYGSEFNLAGQLPYYFNLKDQEIVEALHSLKRVGNRLMGLSGVKGAQLAKQMIATGRCFWNSPDSEPLALGAKRSATPTWVIDEQGNQKLSFEMVVPAEVWPFAPPWYRDKQLCGEIETGLPDKVAATLVCAPTIPVHLAEIFRIEMAGKQTAMPMPLAIHEKQVNDVVPVPCLRLFCIEVLQPAFFDPIFKIMRERPAKILDGALLEFAYDGIRISNLRQQDKQKPLTRQLGAELQRITRQDASEKRFTHEILGMGFVYADSMGYAVEKEFQDALMFPGGENDWIDFTIEGISKLQAAGWQVEMTQSFRFNFAEVEDWTAKLEENAGNDWFGLELGIQVDGKTVNLLPILLNLMGKFKGGLNVATLADMADKNLDFTGRLPDSRLVALPAARVKGILSVLVELFDVDENTERLKLSLVQAARLAELEDADNGLRWMGGERLRALGKRLRDFKGIQPVAAPVGLKAQLRAYQQQGLNWLQFLREYQLAGILADDMGLGKTVQALAHLLLEKESGRMTLPCLVVAPTSLMFNWRHEAERFAPELRVLVLQGMQRKEHFDSIGNYDLVLTTYPLLSRDQEVLTAQDFYYLILDEAHIIKNPKSQATRIVHQLKAQYRLALTGTPLENHLGELWTQFNFLLPGLLGSDKSFRKLFRNPIEKQADPERRSLLARRIAPFLLRRSKAEVASELPPKTEIVRYCQLGGAQRDLYEAIRVIMHEKVQKEINKKGMNRSQIVILDALLKLRQICCDPRLLKLPAAKRVNESAKLELLISLLTEMLQEGRRILLFSQFTSMLALIIQELTRLELPYLLLTGDTTDRETPVSRFQKGEVPLFLISLKAGGVGLNLTAADTVIHYDPWWNPAAENQATDRAHRIGQENPVFVYKLITEGTVEEKIVSMQQRKRDLAKGVLEEGGAAAVPLSADELTQLFEPLEQAVP